MKKNIGMKKESLLKKIFLFALMSLAGILFMGCEKSFFPVDEDGNRQDSLELMLNYKIVGTGQNSYYDETSVISVPDEDDAFWGQNASHPGNSADYVDHGDGTITDVITGLMWQKNLFDQKYSYADIKNIADTLSLAGYTDWRLPSIKELYSLIMFYGEDPSGPMDLNTEELQPFINTDYFDFRYGNEANGERIIEAQFASSTEYVSTTMGGDPTVFGVNFADGRIKGYGITTPMGEKSFEVFFVRGNPDYGENYFVDHEDGTISDIATGLMWTKDDSGMGMNWKEALEYVAAKNEEKYFGYSDWRLPDIKMLQSIVDYERSPETTQSAAIDPIFNISEIENEGGMTDYPFFWSATTHANFMGEGRSAAYVSFGRGLGFMQSPMGGDYNLLDVHGAGCQRSDPKAGDANDYPYGHGPQGDVIRINNFVRMVRDIQ